MVLSLILVKKSSKHALTPLQRSRCPLFDPDHLILGNLCGHL